MSLTKVKKRRYPWFPTEFSNFFGDDDFFNDRFWLRNVQKEPAINVKETDSEYQVELAAPGLEKEDFDLSIENGYLKVKVEKSSESESHEDNYTRKEFNYNSFYRTLLLPENVIEEDVKATYNDGILRFSLRKEVDIMESIPKKIEIE